MNDNPFTYKGRPASLFDGQGISPLTWKEAIDLSLVSLNAYGRQHRHWTVAYSGGKDSTAALTFVLWAIDQGLAPRPETLTALYADTRQELPPLEATANMVLARVRERGWQAKVVLPPMDKRFYVYMLGRGVPPPKNRFRWCTVNIKVDPMMEEIERAQRETANGERVLSITGVRLGESAARDERILTSCSKDSGECGQGWFQKGGDAAVADTLAPLVHWRVCQVFDWLTDIGRHGFPETLNLADVYSDEDVRTGCIGCNLVTHDTALQRLLLRPNWAHLSPLLEIRPMFAELGKARNRLRKAEPEINKDGSYSKNGQRMGPLTFEARLWALEKVLDIQHRARVDLINHEEEARIRELIAGEQWPDGWDGDEPVANVPLDRISVVGNELITQPLLV